MNILHVLSQFEVTGTEAYAATLVEQQAKRGHRLFAVSDTLTLDFRATCINIPIGQRSYRRRLANVRWLVRFIRQNNIQIVHAHSRAASWVGYFATLITNTPFISTVHGRQHVHASSKMFNIYGQHILAVCESIKDHLSNELGIAPEAITVVPNGIPSDLWTGKTPAAKKRVFGVPERSLVLSFIGRLSGPKGDVVRLLLRDVLTRLAKKYRLAFFIIGGMKVPGDIPRLVEEANRGAGKKFAFLKGFQKDVAEYLTASDIVVGSGRVAIKALALGKPLIAFGESHYLGLITEKNFAEAVHSNFGDAGTFQQPEPVRVKHDFEAILSRGVPRSSATKTVEATRARFDVRAIEQSVQQQYEQALIETKSPSVIPVLLYHRVVPALPGGILEGLTVTTAQFEGQLRSLARRGYTTITFSEYAAFTRGEHLLPPRPIILTFDDGYEDNYSLAFPLLQLYGMNAVVYLVANRKRRTNFWDSDQPQVPLLKPLQAREMARAGIEFGSHTISHPHLPALPQQRVRHEIRKSKYVIEDLVGQTVLSFAYPYGELNAPVKEIVAEAGYQYAVAGDSGPVVFFQDPLEIRRIHVFHWTGSLGFWKKTQPWYHRYKALKRQ